MKKNKNLEFTFGEFIGILFKRKILFLIIFIGITLTSIIISFILPKQYEIEMFIEKKGSSTSALSSLGGLASLASVSGLNFQDSKSLIEYERMRSDQVLYKIIEDLKLVEYNIKKSPSLAKKSIIKLKKEIKKNLFDEIKIQDDVSGLVKVSYSVGDPELGAEILNKMFALYLEFDKEISEKKYNDFITRYGPVYDDISEKFEKINKEVIDYSLKNKISDTMGEEDPIFKAYMDNYSAMIDLDKQKEQLKTEIESFEQKYENIDPRLKELFSVNNNRLLSELKNQIVSLNLQLQQLKVNFPSSPKITEIEGELKVLQDNYNKTLNNILQDKTLYLMNVDPSGYQRYIQMKTQYENIDLNKEKSIQMLSNLDIELNTKSPVMYKYYMLKRDQRMLQTQFEYLKNAMEQSKLSKLTYESKYSVFKAAEVPDDPVWPSKKIIAVFGIICAFLIAVFAVIIKELSSKVFFDENEFEKLYRYPDIIIENKEEINTVYKYLYKSNINKSIFLMLMEKENESFSKEFVEVLKNINNQILINSQEFNNNIDKSIMDFENYRNSDKALILFNDVKNTDFIMYKDYADKTFIFVKAKITHKDKVEKSLKYLNDVVVVFMK